MSVRRRASGRAHYNYFRDYDPAVARYTKSDPIGLHGGVNTYAYVFGDPIRKIDPWGLVPGPNTGPSNDCPPDEPDCKKVKDDCIAQCSDDTLPTPATNNGFNFWNCVNKCMEDNGCGPDKKPLPVLPPVRSPIAPPKPSRPPIIPIPFPRLPSFLPPILDPCIMMPELAMCGPPPLEA